MTGREARGSACSNRRKTARSLQQSPAGSEPRAHSQMEYATVAKKKSETGRPLVSGRSARSAGPHEMPVSCRRSLRDPPAPKVKSPASKEHD